jgi:hypothetical protein
MSRIVGVSIVVLMAVTTIARAADSGVYLNAFGETATAYLNDSFLLLGTVADGFVADIISRDNALEMVKNVQKRVRTIRAKLKAVSGTGISDMDRQLVGHLDNAFACVEQQAGALVQFVEEKSPETARRFDAERVECLKRLKKIAEYYSTLPPAPDAPASLNTR